MSPQWFDSAEAAEDAFYDALQRGDAATAIALLADDEDSVCVHPNGPRLRGVAAIRAAWTQILENGGLNIRIADRVVQRSALLSVHSLIERIVVGSAGGAEIVECAATNVFVRDGRGWRMLSHHASTLSTRTAQAPAEVRQGTLH